jgi:hypothetical protein
MSQEFRNDLVKEIREKSGYQIRSYFKSFIRNPTNYKNFTVDFQPGDCTSYKILFVEFPGNQWFVADLVDNACYTFSGLVHKHPSYIQEKLKCNNHTSKVLAYLFDLIGDMLTNKVSENPNVTSIYENNFLQLFDVVIDEKEGVK